jgi:hypothetical protein
MNKLGLSQRRIGTETTSSVTEDAQGSLFQETGQEQRPARMVGLNVLIWPIPAWKRGEVVQFGFGNKGGKNG